MILILLFFKYIFEMTLILKFVSGVTGSWQTNTLWSVIFTMFLLLTLSQIMNGDKHELWEAWALQMFF